MSKRVLITVGVLVVSLFILAMLSVITLAAFAGGSAGGTLASGRSVTTHSDAMFLISEYSKDSATIRTGGKMIVVQPTTLIVDGTTVATIDEKVSRVEVTVKRGTVKFVADGETVTTITR